MKIIIDLQCDINADEALEMVADFEKEPWVKKATLQYGCEGCTKDSCEPCAVLDHIVSHEING